MQDFTAQTELNFGSGVSPFKSMVVVVLVLKFCLIVSTHLANLKAYSSCFVQGC
jgi:hypothetical protein